MTIQGDRVYIIAEAGVNHNGSLALAKRMIDAAVEAGADAVKFQTFKAEQIISKQAPKAEYQVAATGSTETQLEMVKKLELDEDAHEVLSSYCREQDIEFLSTPFDLESVDLLVTKFKLPRLKIPSGEVTNAPLLWKIAQTGKPVILSTGMCTLGEVEMALGVLACGYTNARGTPSRRAFAEAYTSEAGQAALRQNVLLLHCTTEYPTPPAEVNLRAMETLYNSFGLPVGYSDHTEGIVVPIAAVARGAKVLEKHFTLDRNLPGPDHQASLEPQELKEMVRSIRTVEQCLGSARKMPAPTELKNIAIARKSIVAARDLKKGEVFTEHNLGLKRPGVGISPLYFWEMLGKRADRDYLADEVIE